MTLSYREKLLMLALAVVIVLFGGLRLLVLPQYQSYMEKKQSISQLEDQERQAQTDVTAAPGIDSGYESILSKAVGAAAPFFPTLESDTLNKWADELTAQHGYKILSIGISDPKITTVEKTSKPTASQDYDIKKNADIVRGSSSSKAPSSAKATQQVLESDVTMTLSGSYASLGGFLDAVKKCGRTVNVASFSVGKISGAGGSTVSVLLQCYGVEKLNDSDNLVSWSLPPVAPRNLM